jgi:uncharacterized protein YdaL
MASDSQMRATAKYKKSHYDTIQVLVKSGGRDLIKDHAAAHDKSVNAFILRAIRQCLEDDGAPPETIAAICGDGSGAAR